MPPLCSLSKISFMIAFCGGFDHANPMKTTSHRQWIFITIAATLLFGNQLVSGADDSYYGLPLTQVRFDQMIPMSYPTASPGYDRLRPTTSPLIDPGVARIPTTENLVHPTDQPLLIMSEGFGPTAQNRPKPKLTLVIHQATESSRVPAQTGRQAL